MEQSSAYCFAKTIGALQTLAPLIADTSQTNPDSQSASRRLYYKKYCETLYYYKYYEVLP